MGRKTYLVTGGAGFLGSALVRRLVTEGHRVRVLDDQSRGSAMRLADVRDGVEFIEADVRNREAVFQAVRGVESICHLAAINGTAFFYTKPDQVLEVGVKGMVNVLDACLHYGVGEFLLTSSSEVYQTPDVVPTSETVPLSIPDPYNPRYSYAASKIISEMMAIHCGKGRVDRLLIVRPHNVYGPDMGWEHVIPQFVLRMRRLAQEPTNPVPFPIQGSGKETRSFLYIDDFVNGLRVVMEHGEHLAIYHLGTSEEMTVETVAIEVGRYFGKDVRIVPQTPAHGSTLRRCPEISRLTALGFRPAVRFSDGLPLVARWYDEHAQAAPAPEPLRCDS
ncbi:MAG: SDR family NAD(P)-dependent oxidoreductase [Candidatus Omnitrophica bacterium]|nr:SDR family NAD(P)-dependent oxidoreductase [Candidatus Omnitrophota bacterium]